MKRARMEEGGAGIAVFAAPLPRSVRGAALRRVEKRAVERGQPFES